MVINHLLTGMILQVKTILQMGVDGYDKFPMINLVLPSMKGRLQGMMFADFASTTALQTYNIDLDMLPRCNAGFIRKTQHVTRFQSC